MAGRPAGSPNKDKPFKEALRLEIAAAGEDHKALRKVAAKLLARAEEGDISAIREIADRLDGKPNQSMEMTHDVADPLMELLEHVSGKTRGLPKGQ